MTTDTDKRIAEIRERQWQARKGIIAQMKGDWDNIEFLLTLHDQQAAEIAELRARLEAQK